MRLTTNPGRSQAYLKRYFDHSSWIDVPPYEHGTLWLGRRRWWRMAIYVAGPEARALDATNERSRLMKPQPILEPGMVICVESFVGEHGGKEGVKIEEQILITETGYEQLSQYPDDSALL